MTQHKCLVCNHTMPSIDVIYFHDEVQCPNCYEWDMVVPINSGIKSSIKRRGFNMTNIINLTPHAIIINDGTVFQPSGKVARVSTHQVDAGTINGISVKQQTFGDIIDLPAPQPNTIYIVSSIVLSACKAVGRDDVVAPDTSNAVRNEKGHIVSVPGFVR